MFRYGLDKSPLELDLHYLKIRVATTNLRTKVLKFLPDYLMMFFRSNQGEVCFLNGNSYTESRKVVDAHVTSALIRYYPRMSYRRRKYIWSRNRRLKSRQ